MQLNVFDFSSEVPKWSDSHDVYLSINYLVILVFLNLEFFPSFQKGLHFSFLGLTWIGDLYSLGSMLYINGRKCVK